MVPCCRLQAAASLPMAAQICTCPCHPLFYNWFWKYVSIVVTWYGFSNWIIFGWSFLLDVVLVCEWNLCHLSKPWFGIMHILPKTWLIPVSHRPLESRTVACWIEMAIVTMTGLLANSGAVLWQHLWNSQACDSLLTNYLVIYPYFPLMLMHWAGLYV